MFVFWLLGDSEQTEQVELVPLAPVPEPRPLPARSKFSKDVAVSDACLICGHEWVRRKPERPLRCGKCKSPYWDRGRKRVEDTRREKVFRRAKAVMSPNFVHDVEACRIYECGMCAAAKGLK